MTNRLEIYRCEICGNIIQVLHSGTGEPVCCGKFMTLLSAQTNDTEKQEKHVPIFLDNGEIQIGSTPHPMIKEHYIEFVETITEDKRDLHIHFFKPAEEPRVNLKNEKNYTSALEYCNLHGLWQGDKA